MSTAQTQLEQYYSTAIVKGLKAAMVDASIDSQLSKFEDSHIKLNKLMYIAAAEFDILDDLQHSWHIYGSDLGDLTPPTRSVRPAALEDMPRTQFPPEPSIPTTNGESADFKNQSLLDSEFSSNHIDSTSDHRSDVCELAAPKKNFQDDLPHEGDFYGFFKTVTIGELNSLEEILKTDRVNLLEQFYNEYGDKIVNYLDLYLANIRLQALLDKHEENLPVDDIGHAEYSRINQYIRELRKEIYSHNEFRNETFEKKFFVEELDYEIAELFDLFLDLLDDIYFSLSQKSSEDIEGDPSYVISRLNVFYHDEAWNLVTKVISLYTRRGPRQEQLTKPTGTDLREIEDRYHTKFNAVVAECETANLLPTETTSNENASSLDEVDILENGPSLLD